MSPPSSGPSTDPQIITLGCRLNLYESEVMRGHARAGGLDQAVIINTCAVTQEAERQARQAIRKARRDNPQATIIVTGCGVQVNPESFAAMPEVDRVLGNVEKMNPQSFTRETSDRIQVQNIQDVHEVAFHLLPGFEGKTRAFLQIQNGCDHRCTFCIIPFGRGPSRSVALGPLVDQVRQVVDQGVQEVVLTGVDLTAYGLDLPTKPSLGAMVGRLLKLVPDLPRLRLSSLDPAEVDEAFFELLASEPRLMPHLHISLQAGDDLILKRMRRRHLRHHIFEFCQRARALRPDVAFGADVIAGFPTETEAHFANTYQLLQDCQIPFLHIFPYSPRPGTPAARMPPVPSAQIKERAARLRTLGAQMRTHFAQQFIGSDLDVLFEKPTLGHSAHFLPVRLAPGSECPASLVRVRATTWTGDALEGIRL